MGRNREDMESGAFLSGNAPAAVRSTVAEVEHEMSKGAPADLALENALGMVGQQDNAELRQNVESFIYRKRSPEEPTPEV